MSGKAKECGVVQARAGLCCAMPDTVLQSVIYALIVWAQKNDSRITRATSTRGGRGESTLGGEIEKRGTRNEYLQGPSAGEMRSARRCVCIGGDQDQMGLGTGHSLRRTTSGHLMAMIGAKSDDRSRRRERIAPGCSNLNRGSTDWPVSGR